MYISVQSTETAEALAKKITAKSHIYLHLPLVLTCMKYSLKAEIIKECLLVWDNADKCRHAYDIITKVSVS